MSVTAAQGFRAAGVAAGIKPAGLDLALVVNDGPSDAVAAVFTTNRVKAAPVIWSQQAVADGRLRAVVLNSGGANACTGPGGFADTHATAERVAAVLRVGAGDVAVCSTGLIGERLPMPAVLAGVAAAAAALGDHGRAAAEAIRTTDTVSKQAEFTHPDGWTLGGMAKGAGMLAPSLATMLSVLTTDASVDKSILNDALRAAARRTFDRIDSDGCLSTNDTVVLMASGASGVVPDTAGFANAVEQVCRDLALQLLADAEGSTKDGRSPATTCSSAHCSATIPTGGAFSPRSAPRVPRSNRTSWTSRSTGSRCAARAPRATLVSSSTYPAGLYTLASTFMPVRTARRSGRTTSHTVTSKRTRPTRHEREGEGCDPC